MREYAGIFGILADRGGSIGDETRPRRDEMGAKGEQNGAGRKAARTTSAGVSPRSSERPFDRRRFAPPWRPSHPASVAFRRRYSRPGPPKSRKFPHIPAYSRRPLG